LRPGGLTWVGPARDLGALSVFATVTATMLCAGRSYALVSAQHRDQVLGLGALSDGLGVQDWTAGEDGPAQVSGLGSKEWVRHLLRSLAAEGRPVFVSSHLMSEMALSADHLIVIGRGRLIADASVSEVIGRSSANHVRVVSPHAGALRTLVEQNGGTVSRDPGDELEVTGLECREVGILAAGAGLTLYELSPQDASLEDAYMEMTRDSAEFHADVSLGQVSPV
jgi:hypothetical protein